MQRCLELAGNGLGSVAPNPMVGAIIVNRGRVIGEGYHQKFGFPHAEVNAINAVQDKSLLRDSALYVNLEPCAHTGKTPPCSDLIVKSGIPSVVIGTIDPNSLVAGKGIEKLRKAGIEVILGVLEEDCREINRRFFTFYQKKRPYIILKWAQTTDGFIDVKRKEKDPIGINWISNSLSQVLVHKWRAEEQAIMVGSNTVQLDDPQLTVRHWQGKNPLRIVLDSHLKLGKSSRVFDSSAQTLVFNRKLNRVEGNIEYIKQEYEKDFPERIMDFLYTRDIQSLIIEGGKMLLESFLEKDLWDEARVIIGMKQFGRGLSAPEIKASPIAQDFILQDKLFTYRNS